jgi:hypothetical protein
VALFTRAPTALSLAALDICLGVNGTDADRLGSSKAPHPRRQQLPSSAVLTRGQGVDSLASTALVAGKLVSRASAALSSAFWRESELLISLLFPAPRPTSEAHKCMAPHILHYVVTTRKLGHLFLCMVVSASPVGTCLSRYWRWTGFPR